MKGAVIAFICAAALAQAELNENGCPINPYVDVLKPHPNCNKYYQCTQGELLERQCASNLVFDVETQSCDWPANVDCNSRVPPTPDSSEEENQPDIEDGGNSNPSEAPKICATEGSDGVLVAHENCNKFYVCDAGTPVARDCWGNLLFNPANNQCDWPDNVYCGDRIIGGGSDGGDSGSADGGNGDGDNGDSDNGGNSDPSEAPKICAVDGSDGVLVAHENCNKFYKCNGGIPITLDCWGNLLFNPTNNQCDWPENVDCGDRIIGGGNGGSDGGNGDGGNGDGGNEDGGNGDSGNGGNSDPSEAAAICGAVGSNGVLVAHENCNQFYVCDAGTPVARDCWENLLFNPANNQCDWPDNVNCGNRIIGGGNGDGGNEDGGNGDNGNGGNSDPSEATAICAAEGSDGVLVAHEKCNQFYNCHGGKPVVLDCWGNLLFNPANNQCDWPDNVYCGDRIIGGGSDGGDSGSADGGNGDGGNGDNGNGGNSDPSEASAICAAEGSDGILVAHENCNQFYNCHRGKPVALDCWGNLLFNPANNQCDWPDNVNCGDRINGDGGNGDGDHENSVNEGNDDPSQAAAICGAEGSNGVLVAHENCNQFYVCDAGTPVARVCWGNLLFNPTNNQCDWPDVVNCGDRIIDGANGGEDGENGDGGNQDGGNGDNGNGGNSDPSEASAICAAEGSDGVLVAHENCNQFYNCHRGKPVVLDCWGNLLFNPANNQCDWPDNVYCGDRIIGGGSDGGDSGSADGGNGDGGNGDNGNGGSSDPSEASAICAAEGSDGILVAHENCNQFYNCHRGKPVALDCWGNLLFNPANNQCDWPDNVNCGDRIIDGGNGGEDGGNGDGGHGDGDHENSVNEGNDDPSQAAAICGAEGSNGILVAHENCNQFYVCDAGTPVARVCWGNLLFNPTNNQCDWPDVVNCGDRIIESANGGEDGGNGDGGNGNGDNGDSDNGNGGDEETGNENGNGGGNDDPSKAEEICAVESYEDVFVAHEDCNKFYQCKGGKPVVRVCYGDLYFNPSIDACDWPYNYNNAFRAVMGLARYCSASGMFAEARTPCFHSTMRVRAAALVRRVRASLNTVVAMIADRLDCPYIMHCCDRHVKTGVG